MDLNNIIELFKKSELTDYLKTINDEELKEIQWELLKKDIVGIYEKIFEAVNIELEYRLSESQMDYKKKK